MYLLFSFLFIFVFTIFFLVFLVKIIGYIYPYFFWGAINVSTTKEKCRKMIEILNAQPGQIIADLGSGEGALLIALAKTGVRACGYEINPFLVARARKKINEAGVSDKAFVYQKNFWHQNISNFDGVVVFGMKHLMRPLEKKFERELKPGTRIVSNYFTLPTWVPYTQSDKIYLYIKK